MRTMNTYDGFTLTDRSNHGYLVLRKSGTDLSTAQAATIVKLVPGLVDSNAIPTFGATLFTRAYNEKGSALSAAKFAKLEEKIFAALKRVLVS